jgi:hypothetical protein
MINLTSTKKKYSSLDSNDFEEIKSEFPYYQNPNYLYSGKINLYCDIYYS